MRCPDCSKFVSYDDSTEPEVENLEVDEDGSVTGSVRIVLCCSECGNELKEANFDLEVDAGDFAEEHKGEGHELSVEADGFELTTRAQSQDPKTGKAIPYRYQKSFYGASGSVTVSCSCGGEGDTSASESYDWSDDVQASGMDELV